MFGQLPLLGGRSQQAFAGKDVVGEGVPAQYAENLFAATDEELAQAPVAEVGIDAFARGAPLVNAFAVRALHPSAPRRHAGSVVGARSIRIGLVLASHRRSIHLRARCRGP